MGINSVKRLKIFWFKKLPSNRIHRRKTRLTLQNGDSLIHALLDLSNESYNLPG
jgi:hypothetical protein